MLNDARRLAQIPFVITSGVRCHAHNKKVNGLPSSAHLSGKAVDIKADNSRARFKIIEALTIAGFTRIGIAKNFIHVDVDETKPKDAIWIYR